MHGQDLAALAAELRSEGYDARNLAQVGITIWADGVGHFYSLAELSRNPAAVARRDFQAIHGRDDAGRLVAT